MYFVFQRGPEASVVNYNDSEREPFRIQQPDCLMEV